MQDTCFQVPKQSKAKTITKRIFGKWIDHLQRRGKKKGEIQNKIKRAKTLSIKTIAKGFSKTFDLQLSKVQH